MKWEEPWRWKPLKWEARKKKTTRKKRRMKKTTTTNWWIATRGGELADARWKAEALGGVRQYSQLTVRMT
jgi:hypothetical protein